MMPGVSVRPTARSSSFRLSPFDHSPALLKNAWPRKLLPPVLGTRFITGPPMSDSPMPPETATETSSTFTESRTYVDTPPPLNGAATVMPLTVMRPSLVGPPRDEKAVMVGDALSPASPTTRPGVRFSREPTARVAGMAAITSELSTA